MDGLRALAALSVFAVHYNQMVGLEFTLGPFDLATLMANGDHGVSLFFSLSAFLLGLPFWRAIISGNPNPKIKTYVYRRLSRILPAYYFLLTILIVWGQLWKIPGAKIDIFSHYLFIFNFTDFTIYSISPQFWTLAVELQFYFLLPLFFLGIKRLQFNTHTLIAISLLILTSCCLQYAVLNGFNKVIPWPFQPWLNWIRPYGAVLNFSLLATLPHFLFGLCAGFFYIRMTLDNNKSHLFIIHSKKIFWIGLILILTLLSTGWEDTISWSYNPYSFPLIPILIIILILAVAFSPSKKNRLESPIPKKTGMISYGIYLYHYPCLMFLEYLMRQKALDVTHHWFLFGITSFLVTLFMATGSYYIIEKPVLRLVRRK